MAVALALGGDCLADVGLLRAEPGVFGPVASDPTLSRLIGRLAAEPEQAVSAIRRARGAVRARAVGTGRHSAFGQGAGLPYVEEDVRIPPDPGLPQPRRRGHGETAGAPAAAG